MKKSTQIWLWFALALGTGTTVLNATEGRWSSVCIAVIMLAGLCLLLFRQQKLGFYIVCGCNTLSFIVGVYGGISGGTNILLTVIMSFIGAALTPVITYLFIRSQWKELK